MPCMEHPFCVGWPVGSANPTISCAFTANSVYYWWCVSHLVCGFQYAGMSSERAMMTRRDKVGLAILIALFGVLFTLFIFNGRRYGSASNESIGDSVIVQQRIINLQKSK